MLLFRPTPFLILSALAIPACASASGIRVAYLQSDSGSYSTNTLTDLLTGDSRFDLPNSATFNGPFDFSYILANYDVVLASANYSPYFNGDQLADYIDAGGKVVSATFVGQHNIGGRFENEGGYDPLAGNDIHAYASVSLGVYNASHPIMQGVSALSSSQYNGDYTAVASGATLVASWNNGKPLVAVNAAKNVVGVTLFPDVSYFGHASGDYRPLFANSLSYAVNPVPEPASIAALGLGVAALVGKRRKKA